MDSDALKRLIEAVEAGSIRSKFDASFERAIYPQAKAMSTVYLAGEACFGSLDAAKALHDALLPGWWQQQRISTRTRVQVGNIEEMQWCYDDCPARAWLLAILKAKLAEADNHADRDETAV